MLSGVAGTGDEAGALGALCSFTPGTNLRAWLFRIPGNTYLNQRRAARRPTVAGPSTTSRRDR